jgi:hypothetical protein
VIALPGDDSEVVVEMIRLGEGGFRLTVSGPGRPASGPVIVLTTWTPVARLGRIGGPPATAAQQAGRVR